MIEALVAGLLSLGVSKPVVNVPKNYTVYLSSYVNDYGDTLSLGAPGEFLAAFNPSFLDGDLCLSRPLDVVPYLSPTMYVEANYEPNTFEDSSIRNSSELYMPLGFTGIEWNAPFVGVSPSNAYFLGSSRTIRTIIAQQSTNYLHALDSGDWLIRDICRGILVDEVKHHYDVNPSDYRYLDGLEDGNWNMEDLDSSGIPVDVRTYVNQCLDTFRLK